MKTTKNDIDIIDAYQSRDKDDVPFGYVGISDRGGYFFEWRDTLEDTLDSLEADEIDSPKPPFPTSARAALEEAIGDDFDRLHDAAYGPNAAYLCKF